MKKFLALCLGLVLSLSANPLLFKSIAANFTQSIKSGDSEAVYEGSFYARADNYALWSYSSPSQKSIYFTPQNVLIVEPDLEQAILTKLDKNVNLISILAGAKQVSSSLYKAYFDGVEYFVTLDKDGVVSRIDYKDSLDNRVKIVLSGVKTNISLDDEIFKPSIPSSYDVISR